MAVGAVLGGSRPAAVALACSAWPRSAIALIGDAPDLDDRLVGDVYAAAAGGRVAGAAALELAGGARAGGSGGGRVRGADGARARRQSRAHAPPPSGEPRRGRGARRRAWTRHRVEPSAAAPRRSGWLPVVAAALLARIACDARIRRRATTASDSARLVRTRRRPALRSRRADASPVERGVRRRAARHDQVDVDLPTTRGPPRRGRRPAHDLGRRRRRLAPPRRRGPAVASAGPMPAVGAGAAARAGAATRSHVVLGSPLAPAAARRYQR